MKPTKMLCEKRKSGFLTQSLLIMCIFILVINQLDAQNVCFTISLFHDIITPIGVMIPEAV